MLEVALRHAFGGFTLDAAFDAPPGVTVLFGRSGSGKTTIVNAVAGLIRPDGGRVALNGAVLTDTATRRHLPPHRRRVGYVFQEARLFPHLTVRQNLIYGRWFARPAPGAIGLGAVVDLLGIGALLARRPGALSGGERQRVAIGRALLSDPAILLMDEPLAALDTARKDEILPYLERLRDEVRVPILYVSHAVAEVARLATTVVVLEAGRVIRAGPVAAVLADPACAPAFGIRDAGAVIEGQIGAQDADGLTRIDTGAGPLWVPRVAGGIGGAVRLRIAAQDVILARNRPEGLSALNILPVTVTQVRLGDGPGALVQMRAGDALLLARITRRSAEALRLEPGTACFAILKTVAFAPDAIGGVA